MANKVKGIIFGLSFIFTAVGAYNSAIMTSHSDITASEFEMSVSKSHTPKTSRVIASKNTQWKKIESIKSQTQIAKHSEEQEMFNELNLELVEVMMAKNTQNDVHFNGSLTTNGPEIENLEINLSNGVSINVSYSEINGNVFEYEHNSVTHSAVIYKVDQDAYMVSFAGGELDGARLRFKSASTSDLNEEITNSLEVGQFGQDAQSDMEIAALDEELSMEGKSASFKF